MYHLVSFCLLPLEVCMQCLTLWLTCLVARASLGAFCLRRRLCLYWAHSLRSWATVWRQQRPSEPRRASRGWCLSTRTGECSGWVRLSEPESVVAELSLYLTFYTCVSMCVWFCYLLVLFFLVFFFYVHIRDKVLSWSSVFVLHICYYGYSLFTLVANVWSSVHLVNEHQKALLYRGYTVDCFDNKQDRV